jgi:hypothetical protein
VAFRGNAFIYADAYFHVVQGSARATGRDSGLSNRNGLLKASRI